MRLFLFVSFLVGMFAGTYGASKYHFAYDDYLISIISTFFTAIVSAGFAYMMVSIDSTDERAKEVAENILMLGMLLLVGLSITFVVGNIDLPISIERN